MLDFCNKFFQYNELDYLLIYINVEIFIVSKLFSNNLIIIGLCAISALRKTVSLDLCSPFASFSIPIFRLEEPLFWPQISLIA